MATKRIIKSLSPIKNEPKENPPATKCEEEPAKPDDKEELFETELAHIEEDDKETINKVEQKTDDKDSLTRKTFDDMKLKEELLHGIYSYGFENPSLIQQKGILPIVNGYNVIAQAQSGTGKTATFSIGILQLIDINKKSCQAMILSHTKELATQTNNVIKTLGSKMNVRTHLCIGGVQIKEDDEAFRNGVHVVVGTPGRIYATIRKKILKLKDLKIFVIDEADEMLSEGFMDQVKDIFIKTPKSTQVCIFSATYTKKVFDVTKNFISKPYEIMVNREELTLEGIKQFYIKLDHEKNKYDTLVDLYNKMMVTQSLIYVNKRQKAEILYNRLSDDNFTVSLIHGDMTSEERARIMSEFRSGSTRVLITTNLLARGIDVQQVSLVINYDFPNDRENYLHRIGRSGRFGRKGCAISLVVGKELDLMDDVEKYYNTQIQELPEDYTTYF